MVLAGGTSRRFGSDKLSHSLGDATLLASAVSGLPNEARLLVVGPTPPLGTAEPAALSRARWVRESPPGGGPAAAMVTGLRAALAETLERGPSTAIVVLPGDAPQAGAAAQRLLVRLRATGGEAVMAVDPSGREQPLQLALRPTSAQALIDLAGPTAGAGASARALVAGLTPPPLRCSLSAGEAYDIDTRDQLRAWQLRDSGPVREVLAALGELRGRADRPLVVAVAGPSGSGTSVFSIAIRLASDATVLDLGDLADLGDGGRGRADLTVYVGPAAPGELPRGVDLVVDPGR